MSIEFLGGLLQWAPPHPTTIPNLWTPGAYAAEAATAGNGAAAAGGGLGAGSILPVAAAGAAGVYGGTKLADYLDESTRGKYGVDPLTGQPRSVWDRVAEMGMGAESSVTSFLGGEDPGTLSKTAGSVAGGLTAAGMGIGGGVYEGISSLIDAVSFWND